MQKEDLLTDNTFDPCWFLLDYTFKPTYVTNQYTLGFRCTDLKAESPFTFIADNFSPFSTGNWFCEL
jgi:hypothetical protein